MSYPINGRSRPTSAFPLKTPSGVAFHPKRQKLIQNDWHSLQPEIIADLQSIQLSKKQVLQPAGFSDMVNSNYRKKLIPANIAYKKEDLYD